MENLACLANSGFADANTPPLRKGWMRKQGRHGLVRTWRKRFFVLNAGELYYYVDESATLPFGVNLKGKVSLASAAVVEDPTKISEKQILIVSVGGQNNILMETETPAEATEWTTCLKRHIEYAASTKKVGSNNADEDGDALGDAPPSAWDDDDDEVSTPVRSSDREVNGTSSSMTSPKPVEDTFAESIFSAQDDGIHQDSAEDAMKEAANELRPLLKIAVPILLLFIFFLLAFPQSSNTDL